MITPTPIEDLKVGISTMLDSHPMIRKMAVFKVAGSETVKMRRFHYGKNRGLAMEHNLKTQVNLWVHRDAVRLDRMVGIDFEIKEGKTEGHPGRHSNLEQIRGFKGEMLICFTPKTLWEAARIFHEAVGSGTPS